MMYVQYSYDFITAHLLISRKSILSKYYSQRDPPELETLPARAGRRLLAGAHHRSARLAFGGSGRLVQRVSSCGVLWLSYLEII